jgi:hypothetical protein
VVATIGEGAGALAEGIGAVVPYRERIEAAFDGRFDGDPVAALGP